MEHKPLVYSRRNAARALDLSESSLDVLIHSGKLKVIRKGRRVYIGADELERAARLQLDRIWPPKREGKATRHFAPPKPPARAISSPPPKITDRAVTA